MKILTPKLVLESARGRGFAEGDRSSRGGGVWGHAPPEIFILREGSRQSFLCLLVISKGTFQALKQLIFHNFFLDTVYIIVVKMKCFFVRGGSLSN